jgi:hypothetical protein
VPYPDKREIAVMLLAARGDRPVRPEDCIPTNSQYSDQLWTLLLECWSYTGTERPTAAQVLETVCKQLLPSSLVALTLCTDENDHKGRSLATRLISEWAGPPVAH